MLFFVKYPVAGKVKTRIGKKLGHEYACRLYECFVLDLLDKFRQTTSEIIICFDPYTACSKYQDWLGDKFKYLAQRGKTLGERMSNSLAEAFEYGFSKAILTGSDIPDLPVEFIDRSISVLGENNAVIGPSYDGGYYLIGFTAESFVPEAFENIAWGTDEVFEQTLSILITQADGFSTYVLDKWHDIDTAGDIEGLLKRNQRSPFRDLRTISYILEKVDYQIDEIL